MSENILQKNISQLLDENNIDVYELERRAGLKKGNVYNIIKGRSKKPSAEMLRAIADVFSITIRDLYEDKFISPAQLSPKELSLIQEITTKVIDELIENNFALTHSALTTLVSEVFNYSPDSMSPDEKFLKWLVKQEMIKNRL